MSRPNKRIRQEVHCDGCGCGEPDCVSCWSPSHRQSAGAFLPHVDATPFGQPVFHYPPGPSSYFASYDGRPPVPTLPGPPSPAAANPVPSCDYMISQLDEDEVRLILTSLASVSAPAQAAVTSYYQQQVQALRTRVIDFDQYSTDAWHILNSSEYTEGRGSEQYEAAFDACADLVSCIESIEEETSAESSYGTKLGALETLCKIAKMVLLAGDTLGREVRMGFQHETCLADTMVRIVESMTPEEQRRAGANSDAKGSLRKKLRWVCDEADAYCLGGFDLRHVLALIDEPRDLTSGQDRDRLQQPEVATA